MRYKTGETIVAYPRARGGWSLLQGIAAARCRRPPAGFWRGVFHELREDNVLGLAAQMSFFFALSLFPFLIFLAGLVGILPSTGLWDQVLRWMTLYLPQSSQALVFQTVASLTRGGVGFTSIGFFAAAWSASGGLLSLMASLNTCYEVKETRQLWKRLGIAIFMQFVLGFLFIGSFGILTVGHLFAVWINSAIAPGTAMPVIWRVGRWAVSMFLLVIAMAVVDYFLPDSKQPWHWITPGTALAIAAWVPGTLGFNFYVQRIGSYSAEYGALGAFMVLMVWIYLVSLVILIGAEINCELMKRGAAQHDSFRKTC
ncbi:MAG: YihY/virulence factor BrkB family protein [Terriglobia bacterium]